MYTTFLQLKFYVRLVDPRFIAREADQAVSTPHWLLIHACIFDQPEL